MIRDFLPIFGESLELDGNKLRFKGGHIQNVQQGPPDQPKSEQPKWGLYMSKEPFSGGVISAKIAFENAGASSGAEIAVFWDPSTSELLNAGIPGIGWSSFLILRAWEKKATWDTIAQTGDRLNVLKSNHEYHLQVEVHGSLVSLRCDGVEAIRTTLPKQYPPSQIGLMLSGESDIIVSEFKATARRPRTFVIGQFSSPYNEVYLEVIKNVCTEAGIDVVRADETPGPGVIISDVIRDISDSNFVIADISPVNANVFYELGYAAGINKPAILIAERGTKLPFDVSPNRTLFYDNTIAGKAKLEKGLRDAIFAVLGRTSEL